MPPAPPNVHDGKREGFEIVELFSNTITEDDLNDITLVLQEGLRDDLLFQLRFPGLPDEPKARYIRNFWILSNLKDPRMRAFAIRDTNTRYAPF
jgi:hypothetical protein